MIVCSCNVLSEAQIIAALKDEDSQRPATPAQAYRCLGCAPRCGRCVATVRALIAQTRVSACNVGCPVCPGDADHRHAHNDNPTPLPMAAE